jgi:hypothetical protein
MFPAMKKSIFLPQWLAEMPDGPAKTAAKNRFYIRLAGLYATENGTLADLASLIGVNYNTLKSQVISKCLASQKTQDGIKRLLGDAFVPKTDL